MRASARIFASLLVAVAVSALGIACHDSNEVTGGGMAVADLSGSWSGQYDANVPTLCSNGTAAAATLSITQTGNQVVGVFKAQGCGIGGGFRGTLRGNMLTGAIDMMGCTGGGVSGQLDNGALSFTVGDFNKGLINGDVEVMPGGFVRMQR
jgi:hypothetical protein